MFRAGLRRRTDLGRRWGVTCNMSRPTGSLTLVFDVRTASGRSVSQVPVDNFLTITYTDVTISL